MTGLARTGLTAIGGEPHLVQSINDILSTRKGTRVLRRDYGSDLPALIDAPINGETVIDLFMATAEALDAWEPRLKLRRVEIAEAAAGRVTLQLTGEVSGIDTTIEAEVAA